MLQMPNCLTFQLWERVKSTIEKQIYGKKAKKLVDSLSLTCVEWSRFYFTFEAYCKGERWMDDKVKKACDDIMRFFNENNIPESEWLGIINQADQQVKLMIKDVPINKLMEWVEKEKKSQ